MKDISELSTFIRFNTMPAWEAFINGDVAKAYRLYREIEMAARAAGDACQPDPAKGERMTHQYPKGWPYVSPK
jgi:hypothetical protein